MYISLRGNPQQSRSGAAGTGVPRTVVTLGVVSLLTDVSSEAVTAILPLYVTAGLGLSVLAYSVVEGVYQGAGTLVRLPSGWLADRLGHPKHIALAGYALSALSKVGLLLVTGLTWLTGVVVANRVGKGIRTAPRDNLIGLASHPDRLGRSFGVHRSMDTVGACLGPVVAFGLLWLLPHDYSAVFVVSLAFALVAIAVLVLFVPDVSTRPELPEQTPRQPLSTVVSGKARALLGVAAPLSLLSIGDGLVYLALLENDLVEASWFPLLALGTAVVYLVSAIPLGALADRVGRCRLFVLGHLPLVAVYAAILAGGPGVWASLLAVVALGVYYACTDGVLAAVSSSVAPEDHRTTTIALTQTTAAVGRMVATVTFGVLWAAFGPEAAVLVFVGLLAVVVPLCLVLVRRSDLVVA